MELDWLYMLKKILKNKILFIIGIILVCISFYIMICKYYQIHKDKLQEENAIDIFFEKTNNDNNINENISVAPSPIVENKEPKEQVIQEFYDYIAVLKIPKINLEKGLVSKDSKYNNVYKNVTILKESDMPDIKNGNVILASHAGSSNVAYFKNLYKLKKNDEVYIFYNGLKYTYIVNNITEVDKDGKVIISRIPNENLLTLITCKIGTKKQIVIVCKLKESEGY